MTMRSIFLLLLVAGVALAQADPYPEFAADRVLLRKQRKLEVTGPARFVSSPEAQGAARRIFERVSFLHKKKSEVLAILGDPKTISDFGEAASKEKDAPLTYCFADGEAGFEYRLKFRNESVISIEWFGLE